MFDLYLRRIRTWVGTHWVWALLAGGALATALVVGLVHTRRLSTPHPQLADTRMQVVGFYENQSPGDPHPGSLASLQRNASRITTVSPLWFSVNPDGTVSDLGYDAAVVAFSHQHHIAVVPLVTNAAGSSSVLWLHSTRQAAARNIAQTVRNDHLDGVNLDFELLNPSSRDSLSRFVADLAHALHPMNKVLAVSVFPLVDIPWSVNGADDYAALAQSANYLVMMAYDHHYSGGPAGPVAPYGWVEANVDAALRVVPANHLVLAIGMYGYDWINNGQSGPAATVSDVQAKALAQRYGASIQYLAADSQNMFTYQNGGIPHIVYFMGNRSAQARLGLARQKHLAGVALWRLGDEDPAFWQGFP
ncbi:MAG: glycosyl hydrolase family 18 protein [Thermaerobacter sp.]|nr:glycosyl hydrolase family 18 protein [Thermaerobacter sp.]